MAIKNISGVDFKAFFNDPAIWSLNGDSDAFYCEDLVLVVQGQEGLDMDGVYDRYGHGFENLPDDAILEFESGYRRANSGYGRVAEAREDDMLTLFREWQKNRADVTFVATISVPKGDADALARVERALAELADLGVSVQRSDRVEPERKPAGMRR